MTPSLVSGTMSRLYLIPVEIRRSAIRSWEMRRPISTVWTPSIWVSSRNRPSVILARPIGVGQHPIGFDLDFFDGSVYETRVSLGALGAGELLYIPEPSSCVTLALGLAALLSFRKRPPPELETWSQALTYDLTLICWLDVSTSTD